MNISLNWIVEMELNKNIYENKYLVKVESKSTGDNFFINKDIDVDHFMRSDLNNCLYSKEELKDYIYYNNCLIRYCRENYDGPNNWREYYEDFGKIEVVKVEDFIEDNLDYIVYYYRVKDINEFKEKYNNIKLKVKKIIREELLVEHNYNSINNLKHKINNIIIDEFDLRENYHCNLCLECILEVLFK
jgi:hypothetical protein